MLCIAAAHMGIRTVTVERQQDCPASAVSHTHQVGDWNDPEVLARLASECDVVTLENEFVHATSLHTLANRGVTILPPPICLETIQDKLRQKQTLQAAGLPTPRFLATDTIAQLRQAAEAFGFPFVLKSRRNGYDGKGNFTVRSVDDFEPGWNQLNGNRNALFAEAFCSFKAEIAIMVCRSATGQTVSYPVVETIQKDHICHTVKAPAKLSDTIASNALSVASQAVDAVQGIGALGVELFLTQDDEIVINELAPRVHNSGHYTIEGCHTSQFENHIRAVLGLPLGNPGLVKPAAVMVNLLGDAHGSPFPSGIKNAFEIDDAHLHLYGKDQSKPGRKMGHLTVIGDSMDIVLERAQSAADQITFDHKS